MEIPNSSYSHIHHICGKTLFYFIFLWIQQEIEIKFDVDSKYALEEESVKPEFEGFRQMVQVGIKGLG